MLRKYRYTALFISTILVAILIGHFGYIDAIALSFSQLNTSFYAFLSGAMYAFTFTSSFSILLFSNLSIARESIFMFSVIAALGGMISDVLIFRFIKDVVFEELGPYVKKFIEKATKKKITKTLIAILGGIMIASPFPDELGLTLMGISKISFWKLVFVTFCLDLVGTYLIILAVAQIY